jgi:Ca-activated chloride channel homolog
MVYNLPMVRPVRRCLGVPVVCLLLPAAGFSQTLFTESSVTIAPRARPSVPQPESQTVLRSDASLVVIPTWVSTATGISVTDLSRDNFRVEQDSVDQPISYFVKDDAPVSIGLLFDMSGSMKTKMEKAAQAVQAFFETANTEDEFFLVEFSDRARLAIPFTKDSEEIHGRIAAGRPAGRTSLLDAIELALKQMKKAKHARKALVIVSDGGDNWSRHTAREVRGALLESDVQLYAMGIFDPDLSKKSPIENQNGPALLDELALESGGRQYRVANVNDLPSISRTIGIDLRNEYLIGYHPAESRDGKYHHVKVKLHVPRDTPPLHASYRKGYYATSE